MTAENHDLNHGAHRAEEMAEALVLSGDSSQRQELVDLVEGGGVLTTGTADLDRALDLARQKHFAVIVLDLDTPSQGAGLEQIKRFEEASPASTVFLCCREASYERAVDGFRHGAADVIGPHEGDYLKDRVATVRVESQKAEQRDRLLQSTLELHDEFLRRLMYAHRQAVEAREAADGQIRQEEPCTVLVVDDNPRTAPGLEGALGGGFRCVSATNGGEALDYAGGRAFDIALVKASLPDLSGNMVARTLGSQNEGCVVLLFEHPGDTPGFVSIIEGDQSIEVIPELKGAPELVDRIRELHTTYAARRREKRHVASFRRANADFLRSYVKVRQQIREFLPEGDE